jgi:hypothetical protein
VSHASLVAKLRSGRERSLADAGDIEQEWPGSVAHPMPAGSGYGVWVSYRGRQFTGSADECREWLPPRAGAASAVT